jgi:hypothetical protein
VITVMNLLVKYQKRISGSAEVAELSIGASVARIVGVVYRDLRCLKIILIRGKN